MIMLTHGSNFHIKRTYLENRCKLHSKTLKRYLAEIEEDGVIRVERVHLENGSPANIYHTNPVSEWRLREDPTTSPVRESYSDSATSTTSLVSHSPVSHSPVREFNKNKGEPEKEESEKMVGWKSTQPVEREPSDPLNDPSLIDACKRLEYLYKAQESDYVDYRSTRELLFMVRSNYGQDRLDHFIGWMEQRWQEASARHPKFAFRPERMKSHWHEYLGAHQALPGHMPLPESPYNEKPSVDHFS